MKHFENLIERFSKVKILVIGDLMLDRYWWGSVSRISPEAPVPVVRLEKMSVAAGGAANVAANIAGLGAEALLLGIIGTDTEGKTLTKVLRSHKVAADLILKIKTHPTIVKTRIVAHNQHVVRIDQETTVSLEPEQEKQVFELIGQALEKADLVLVSDYAKGLLSEKFLTRLITLASRKGKKIFVDPKGKDFSKYANATILTPNQREAIEADKNPAADGTDLEKVGGDLIQTLNLESLLITRGEHGMSLFRRDERAVHLRSLARKVYDVTGAGDTVISTLAVAFAAGAGMELAAELANIAAGLVVEEVGTTFITKQKLLEHLR